MKKRIQSVAIVASIAVEVNSSAMSLIIAASNDLICFPFFFLLPKIKRLPTGRHLPFLLIGAYRRPRVPCIRPGIQLTSTVRFYMNDSNRPRDCHFSSECFYARKGRYEIGTPYVFKATAVRPLPSFKFGDVLY
jgi:hypothetical protein